MSAAGDALQRLPASVARFRIWIEPTTWAASTSAGNACRTRGSAMSAVMTVVAPIRSRPFTSWIPGASSATRFRSITSGGSTVPFRTPTRRSVPAAQEARRGLLTQEAMHLVDRGRASVGEHGWLFDRAGQRPSSVS